MARNQTGIEITREFRRAGLVIGNLSTKIPDTLAEQYGDVLAAVKEIVRDVIRSQAFPGASKKYSDDYEIDKTNTVGHVSRLILNPDENEGYANSWQFTVFRKRFFQSRYRWDLEPDPKTRVNKWKFNGSGLSITGKSRMTFAMLGGYLERIGYKHGEAVFKAVRKEVNSNNMKIKHRLFRIVQREWGKI